MVVGVAGYRGRDFDSSVHELRSFIPFVDSSDNNPPVTRGDALLEPRADLLSLPQIGQTGRCNNYSGRRISQNRVDASSEFPAEIANAGDDDCHCAVESVSIALFCKSEDIALR